MILVVPKFIISVSHKFEFEQNILAYIILKINKND